MGTLAISGMVSFLSGRGVSFTVLNSSGVAYVVPINVQNGSNTVYTVQKNALDSSNNSYTVK